MSVSSQTSPFTNLVSISRSQTSQRADFSFEIFWTVRRCSVVFFRAIMEIRSVLAVLLLAAVVCREGNLFFLRGEKFAQLIVIKIILRVML